MKKYFLLLVAFAFLFVACTTDDNIVPEEPDTEQEETEEEVTKTAADYPVQNFMWRAMNAYYFWQQDMPILDDDNFDGLEGNGYVGLLAANPDPVAFFNKLLFSEDRFSFYSEDYNDLVQSFQGVSKSNGLEFGLSLFGNDREVFGFVEYVVKDSDAATKDIARGDIFITVDGTQLYYNDASDNNLDLLDNDTYTLGMADIIDNTIVPNDKEVTLTKVEGLAENPILVSQVIEQNGIKVGYLVYNGFVANYDDELNDVFGQFAAENINELILDFRYNPGGRVSSAIQIASSVYGTNTDEVFIRPRFNDKLQDEFGEPNNFTDVTFDSETPINVLGLDRVFVITTGATASASELVINGLEPYVDVVQVGTQTVGKNEFSNTFVDDLENGYFYTESRENEINPDNQWAIQPLLGRNENAEGFSDYTGGLLPDYELEEDIANLGTLGEIDEPLLALALSIISGETGKRSLMAEFPVDYVGDSKMFKKSGHQMVMDGLIRPFKFSE